MTELLTYLACMYTLFTYCYIYLTS